MNQDFHLHFIRKNQIFGVDFQEKMHASNDTVLINGRNYALQGDSCKIEWLKSKFPELTKSGLSFEELQLKLIELGAKELSVTAKICDIGINFFNCPIKETESIEEWTTEVIQENILALPFQSSKVLQELRPTWPIPNTPPIASITDRMKELGVSGARIALINNGKLEWSQGFQELEKSGVMIQAASISKTINSLTILSLIQEGAKTPKGKPLTLDTKIKDILDKELWKFISNGHKEPITIRQLMSHTAGLEKESKTGYRGYYRESKMEIIKIEE